MMEMLHTNYIKMMIILDGFRFSYVYVYGNVNDVEMMIIMIILKWWLYWMVLGLVRFIWMILGYVNEWY